MPRPPAQGDGRVAVVIASTVTSEIHGRATLAGASYVESFKAGAEPSLLRDGMSRREAARLGGLRRVALHGLPGTPESRRRGGLASAAKQQSRVDVRTHGGWCTRKPIVAPSLSTDLAEFIGIFLGDGGFRSRWQIGISFNRHTERSYAAFIQQLIWRLFNVEARLYVRESSADLIVSSVALGDLLEELGLRRGPKQKTVKDIPAWIRASRDFRIACLRGLMDTDGCVFRHRYRVNGTWYAYPKLGFAGAIAPLCRFVLETLRELGITAYTHQRGQRVFVYSTNAVREYFRSVGTHNDHHQKRLEQYVGEVPKWLTGAVC